MHTAAMTAIPIPTPRKRVSKKTPASSIEASITSTPKADSTISPKVVDEIGVIQKAGTIVNENPVYKIFSFGPSLTDFRINTYTPTSPDYKSKRTKAINEARFYYGRASEMIGMDPECFLMKDNELIPPWELGFSLDKEVIGTYADGFACEMRPVARGCALFFTENVRNAIADIYSKISVGGVVMRPDVDYVDVSKHLPIAPSEAIILGCSKSLNAYGDSVSLPEGSKLTVRTAGAHIHIGDQCYNYYDLFNNHKQVINPGAWYRHIVRTMDLICGVPLTLLFKEYENPLRRQYYGRAGEYRLPQHGGIEYRVPGPMLISSPAIMHLGIELARRAWSIAAMLPDWYMDVRCEDIQDVINNHNIELGLKIFNDNFSLWGLCQVPRLLQFKRVVNTGWDKVQKYNDWKNVMHPFNPVDMATNWGINNKWYKYTGGDEEDYENIMPHTWKQFADAMIVEK